MSIDRSLPKIDIQAFATITETLSRVRNTLSQFRQSSDSSSRNKWQIKYGGFVIAMIGFVLTRVTVLPFLHLKVPLDQFVVGQVIPLALGLVIIVLGISLAVSTLPRSYVNRITAWCVLATTGMGLVDGFVVLQVSLYTGFPSTESIWLHSLFANTLIAGALGGILVGVYSADNQQQRYELTRQSDQLTLLNRILRHEILNKITVIQGYTDYLATEDAEHTDDSVQAIGRSADYIETIIGDIGFLTKSRSRDATTGGTIDAIEVIKQQVQNAQERYPNAVFQIEEPLSAPEDSEIQADTHLHTVFKELFENAVEYNDSSPARIDVNVYHRDTHVEIHVKDNGPGLPDDQRDILQSGDLPEYDDPTTGFGLSLVRMLVSQYGGTITVDERKSVTSGTSIVLSFPRASRDNQDSLTSRVKTGITPQEIASVILAALIAGELMGVILQSFSSSLFAIGGLYGVQSSGIGWVLHLFHSVIFGVLFGAVLSRTRLSQYTTSVKSYVMTGLGYGLVLWMVAAGVVMPVWLTVMGISTPIPNLTLPSLFGHIVWGVSVGGLYGYLTE